MEVDLRALGYRRLLRRQTLRCRYSHLTQPRWYLEQVHQVISNHHRCLIPLLKKVERRFQLNFVRGSSIARTFLL